MVTCKKKKDQLNGDNSILGIGTNTYYEMKNIGELNNFSL